MVLQDIPGCEGSRIVAEMGDEYINEFKLGTADACLLVYTSVFERKMLRFAEKLETEHNVPVFFVRNKVGTDCRNEVSDWNAQSNSDAFYRIQERALEQIQNA